jgi:hypothetical protein
MRWISGEGRVVNCCEYEVNVWRGSYIELLLLWGECLGNIMYWTDVIVRWVFWGRVKLNCCLNELNIQLRDQFLDSFWGRGGMHCLYPCPCPVSRLSVLSGVPVSPKFLSMFGITRVSRRISRCPIWRFSIKLLAAPRGTISGHMSFPSALVTHHLRPISGHSISPIPRWLGVRSARINMNGVRCTREKHRSTFCAPRPNRTYRLSYPVVPPVQQSKQSE